MRLVTVATHSDGYFPFLVKSCERNGAKLDVLGWGQKWQGYAWKLVLMKEFLRGLDDDEVVCFIDAYDVLLLRPLEELEAAFRDFARATGCEIVVGCDNVRKMHMKFLSKWVFGTCQHRPINSGTYIGFAGAIRRTVDKIGSIAQDPSQNDQVLLTQYCRRGAHRMHIDCDNVFFLTVLDPLAPFMDGSMHVENGQLFHHGLRPFVVHGNGNTDMNDVIVKLGYDFVAEDMRALDQFHRVAVKNKLQNYFPYFINLLACIVGLCIAFLVAKKLVKRT